MDNILFINHIREKCGVHQYGARLARSISGSKKYNIVYAAIDDRASFDRLVNKFNPVCVIYNYYPGTTGVVSWPQLDSNRRNFPQVALRHDPVVTGFDYYIYNDPTLGREREFYEFYRHNIEVGEFEQDFLSGSDYFKLGRTIPYIVNNFPLPEIPTIGTFGFVGGGKMYDFLVTRINRDFDEAIINVRITPGHFGDHDGIGAREVGGSLKYLITKPGIELNVSYEFLPERELLESLAKNTINAFFYDHRYGYGISSSVDYALAVQRPIAITRSHMFRHLWPETPEICMEDHTIPEIIALGTKPLEKFYKVWTDENLVKEFDEVMGRILYDWKPTAKRFGS